MNNNIKKLIQIAESYDRHNIYNLPGCPQDTCAFFVRHVFEQLLHEAGRMPVAHERPYYKEHNVRALPTSENFADGLAGDVVGQKVPLHQIQAGDLLFFRDTYFAKHGEFPVGSITHVGIALDSNGLMADSSSGVCHVRNYKSTFPGLLVEARRPRCLGASVQTNGVGISLIKGQVIRTGNCQEQIEVLFGTSPLEFKQMHKAPRPIPSVTIDRKTFHYKYITIDVVLNGGKHVKMFSHNGRTNAYVGGQKVPYLNVAATLKGGLHVYVEGKEVKPTSVNIGVS